MSVDSRVTAGPESDEGESDLDLRAIGAAIGRNKLWIAGATLAAFVGMLAFVTVTKPRYTAEAKVIVENQESFFTRPDKNAVDNGQGPDAEAIASQVQVVMSRDLARDAIRQLDLKGNAEFDPLAGGGMLSRLGMLLGAQRSKENLSPEDRILETYFEKLNVFQVTKSRVLTVEFSSQDPDLAARAANKVADLYIELQSNAKRDAARQAAASLAAQISDLRARLMTAEQKAEGLRTSTGLLVGANNTTLNAQQLAELNTQLSAARTAQAEAQAKAKLMRDMLRQGRLGDVTDIANNELVRRLSEQVSTLRGQLALESRTLLSGHPRIKELSAQLANIEGELRLAVDKVARGLENDARIAGARFESVKATLEQQKKTVGTASPDEITLRQLDSDTRLIRDQLESSVAKYQEALARENSTSTPGDARVISRAMPPQLPSFPKKVPMLVFATLAGAVLSLGAVVAGELLRSRDDGSAPEQDGEDADSYFMPARPEKRMARAARDIPSTPARAPRGPLVTARRARAQDEDQEEAAPPAEDSVGDFVARVGRARPESGGLRVLVTSAASDPRFTDAAVDIGRKLARRGRTILVEMSSGALAHAGIEIGEGEAAAGVNELMDGEVSFAEAIHRDSLSRLHVVLAGAGVLRAGESLENVLGALSETYDYVVLATRALASDGLALDLASTVDYVAVVTGGGSGGSGATAAEAELLRSGAPDVSIVAIPAGARGRRGVTAA